MPFCFAYSRRAPLSCFAVLALLGWGAVAPCRAQAQQPAKTPARSSAKESQPEVERSEDAYEIYSMLTPGEALAKMPPSLNQRWAIAEMTVSAGDLSPALAPEAALKAPESNAKAFHEAVGDYEARKDERLRLLPKFRLDRPYTSLTPAEVAEFRSARSTPMAPAALREKYSGYPGLTYFSQVFFNKDRTAALVYMVDWCGNLCAGGEWVYLEKRNGRWIRRSGRS